MANIYTGFYKRFNGTDWDTIYFKAPASAISETDNRKWLDAIQQANINTYLQTFNAANKLLKLDSSGKIPTAQLPFTIGDYLKKSGGTMTGALHMSSQDVTGILKLKGASAANPELNFALGMLGINIDGIEHYRLGKTGLNVVNKKITNLKNPTEDRDAATKQYVDQLVATGTNSVEAAQVATTTNITLSGLGTVDGYQLKAGDRILVKDQTTATQNGVYVTGADVWIKQPNDSKAGALIFVEHGTVNNDSTWMSKETNEWLKFSQVDLFEFGEGLAQSGDTVKLADAGVLNKHIANNAAIALTKLANTTKEDSRTYLSMTTLPKGIQDHFTDLASAIKLLRGTTNYNTSNSQTIAGAYTEINTVATTKNRTYIGTAAPSGSAYISGDIYIHHE